MKNVDALFNNFETLYHHEKTIVNWGGSIGYFCKHIILEFQTATGLEEFTGGQTPICMRRANTSVTGRRTHGTQLSI